MNSVLNKLNITLYYLLLCFLVDWFIIFIAVPKLPKKLWAGNGKLPTRLNSALFIDWLGRTLKTENIDESTTFEIEKTLSACKP
jgi:hypothetical protein